MKNNLWLLLKGIAMGAADIIPGVSGGTIAFITGIYEKLVFSLKSISDKENLSLLFKLKIIDFWKNINGNFLLIVFGGILISVFSLSKLITFLLDKYPMFVWAYFFGLILTSIWHILHNSAKPNLINVLIFLIFTGIAFYITSLPPINMGSGMLNTFLAGTIAICAMILPGISGSFILLILGQYRNILKAVNNLDITTLLVFTIGTVIGLILFSKFLSWLLKKYKDATIYALSGFMLGALNKVWPWKITLSWFIDRQGNKHPLLQKNLLPTDFATQTGTSPQVEYVLLFFILGVATILFFELLTREKKA
jgi:putative membrane protein